MTAPLGRLLTNQGSRRRKRSATAHASDLRRQTCTSRSRLTSASSPRQVSSGRNRLQPQPHRDRRVRAADQQPALGGCTWQCASDGGCIWPAEGFCRQRLAASHCGSGSAERPCLQVAGQQAGADSVWARRCARSLSLAPGTRRFERTASGGRPERHGPPLIRWTFDAYLSGRNQSSVLNSVNLLGKVFLGSNGSWCRSPSSPTSSPRCSTQIGS